MPTVFRPTIVSPSWSPPYPSNLTFITPVQQQLIGLDQFFYAPGQGPNYDWPNPISVQRKGDNAFYNNLLPLLAVSPFSPLDWPNPLTVQRKGDSAFYNNLLPLLPPPFSSFDWPNPITAQRKGDSPFYNNVLPLLPSPFSPLDWPNPLPQRRLYLSFSTIPWPIGVPFSQSDWPNPVLLKYPPSLRVFTNPVATNLIGRDKFFTSPGVGPNYDWPNPVRRPKKWEAYLEYETRLSLDELLRTSKLMYVRRGSIRN